MIKRRRGLRCAAVAVCMCLFLAATLGIGSLYIRWRWLGCPTVREILFNLSDGYPGHSLNCIRGNKVTYDSILGDAKRYGSFVEKYGEPKDERMEEEGSLHRLTAVYDDCVLVFQGYGAIDKKEYMLQEMTILSDKIELPVSHIRLGSSKWKADMGYRFNETKVIDGVTYYEEPICLMCSMDQFYISLQYKDGRVSGIRVRMETWG